MIVDTCTSISCKVMNILPPTCPQATGSRGLRKLSQGKSFNSRLPHYRMIPPWVGRARPQQLGHKHGPQLLLLLPSFLQEYTDCLTAIFRHVWQQECFPPISF